jgi:MYXO-CTERM domain-containing protein
MFLADKTTGKLVQIANSTRGNNINKPTDLIETAIRQGINVDNPNNQRGPHMVVPVTDNSFLVGMQYNNQAQEAFRVTIDESGASPRVIMNWLQRFSNDAQHCRPQVAYTAGAKEAFLTAVEANSQPADIGIRLVKLNVDTGKAITSKVVIKSDPDANKYVAEPSIADLGTAVAVQWARSAKARNRDGANGHAGGSNVSQLSLFSKADLSRIGTDLVAPANYQRHAHIFATRYGTTGELAAGVISGSSTGTSKGLLQIVPLKADGTLGLKDPLKMYTVSTYSDVANLQARGKRNPNNQAKGFINGLGDVPNPGYQKVGGFYPEVKSFSMSTVTGYSGEAARAIGRRESLWLSLVPATWDPKIQTTPGVPSEMAGTGPAPTTTTSPPTDPSGEVGEAPSENGTVLGNDPTTPGEGARSRATLGEDTGCNVAHRGGSSGFGAIALAALGVIVTLRRRAKTEEV